MTKVILLGDSIRQIGYGKKVPALLGDGYEVWQPAENCRFAQYTLRGMWDWKEQLDGADIVHWNNGLWDVCELFDDGPFTAKESYIATMLRIAEILQKKVRKVIFATTTPVTNAHRFNSNARIMEYNCALVPELEKMGVAVNDLHALVWADVDKYISHQDNIHLNEAGIDLCSEAVVRAIRKAQAELA